MKKYLIWSIVYLAVLTFIDITIFKYDDLNNIWYFLPAIFLFFLFFVYLRYNYTNEATIKQFDLMYKNCDQIDLFKIMIYIHMRFKLNLQPSDWFILLTESSQERQKAVTMLRMTIKSIKPLNQNVDYKILALRYWLAVILAIDNIEIRKYIIPITAKLYSTSSFFVSHEFIEMLKPNSPILIELQRNTVDGESLNVNLSSDADHTILVILACLQGV